MWYEFLLKLMIVSVSSLFVFGCFVAYRYVMEDGPLAKKTVEQARRQSLIDLGNTIKDARDEGVEVKDFSSKKEVE